jgi:hypothetical protein
LCKMFEDDVPEGTAEAGSEWDKIISLDPGPRKWRYDGHPPCTRRAVCSLSHRSAAGYRSLRNRNNGMVGSATARV